MTSNFPQNDMELKTTFTREKPLADTVRSDYPDMSLAPKTFITMETFWMILIIIGNTITIFSVVINQKLRTMVSRFIVSLCVANLLYGLAVIYRIMFLSMPHVMDDCFFCCIAHFVSLLVPSFAILYGLMAVTIDRYIAVVHPLRYPDLMSASTVTAIIFIIWALSVSTGCIPLFWNEWLVELSPTTCVFLRVVPKKYTLIFVIPAAILSNVVILFVYFRIWKIRHSHLRRICVLGNSNHPVCRKELQTTFTVGIIVISCALAFVPLIVTLTLASADVEIRYAGLIYPIAYEISFVNPVLTPVIYVWRTVGFKKVLKAIMCCASGVSHSVQTEPKTIATEMTTIGSSTENSRYIPECSSSAF